MMESSNHPPELENLGAACEFRIPCFSIATSEVLTPRRSFLQARQVAKVRGVQGALGLDHPTGPTGPTGCPVSAGKIPPSTGEWRFLMKKPSVFWVI